MRIKKAVITAAGTGTRLLPFTKETPKEMLPVYSKVLSGKLVLKPILQVIYESIFDFGVQDFCIVVGRGKRVIEDHFLITDKNNKTIIKHELEKFFEKIQKTNLIFTQQPLPLGFGDAIYTAKYFVRNENFLLHAGDDVILSSRNSHLKRLEEAFFKHDADIAFLVSYVDDPKDYGVIEGKKSKDGVIIVKGLEEKPKKPKSNLVVIAIYLFKPTIFKSIEKTKKDKKGEIQLADAIKSVIKTGKVIAVELKNNEMRIDVGTAESYITCLNMSYKFTKK